MPDAFSICTADEAAKIKKGIGVQSSTGWHAHLWEDVPAAVTYANSPPLSQAGSIVFNIRDNGQVWTYDLH